MRRIDSLVVAGMLVAAFMQQPAIAASPSAISFQGRLADGEGAPIGEAVNVVFSLHDAETAGTQVWAETHSGLTPDANGMFSVMLGEADTFQAVVDFSGSPAESVGRTIAALPILGIEQRALA